MKHFGDITKIDGHLLPEVDVVTGGSPCQDLSVAGKRAGLAGERSGLFMDQVRVIKEMREQYVRTHGSDGPIRPNWMVWENVPGALSSNDGEDFRAVLEETIRIVDPAADVPRPEDRWSPAGCILGDGWSLAWRIHDAQFWGRTILDNTGKVVKRGTPQRRRRIALVAHFGGESAPEILFERKGVFGDIETSNKTRQGIAEDSQGRIDMAVKSDEIDHLHADSMVSIELDERGNVNEKDVVLLESNQNHATIQTDGISTTLPASMGMGGGYVPMVVDEAIGVDAYNQVTTGGKAKALTSIATDSDHIPCVCVLNDQGGSQMDVSENRTGTLRAQEHGHQPIILEPGSPENNDGMDRSRKVIALTTEVTPKIDETGKAFSLRQRDYKDPQSIVSFAAGFKAGQSMAGGIGYEEGLAATLSANCSGTEPTVMTMQAIGEYKESNQSSSLKQRDYKDATDLVITKTVPAVRRLTPKECERLQGFPDGWTEIGNWVDSAGKKHKGADGPRYKALGNSIALPFWEWMAERICAYYDRPVLLGSLFDGIGGFPLAFSRHGGIPVWASEIEAFPIAVTKLHFPEEET